MVELSSRKLAINWLKNKLINRKNGLVFDDLDSSSFDIIQSFLEANDHPLKTPAIYYQAFPGESTAEFLSILSEELTAKLGNLEFKSGRSLSEIIDAAGLKLIIIDRSYLHPLNTLDELLRQFADCNVGLILVGTYSQMKIAKIISHPTVSQWSKLAINCQCESLAKIC